MGHITAQGYNGSLGQAQLARPMASVPTMASSLPAERQRKDGPFLGHLVTRRRPTRCYKKT
jgi:hypothetical protein